MYTICLYSNIDIKKKRYYYQLSSLINENDYILFFNFNCIKFKNT